ncbi:hypothetical protein PsorP6_008143 [Peronosclerospora sorghi]|uniref:Uncharacterized protein n=1 Tax=Peronosclerospora sorghi TaxID=230839 RepID=A0ACC0W9F4_9STRA|nr:hypothetical protein PsorP6_008143 [Peronosclerospora sorghi]
MDIFYNRRVCSKSAVLPAWAHVRHAGDNAIQAKLYPKYHILVIVQICLHKENSSPAGLSPTKRFGNAHNFRPQFCNCTQSGKFNIEWSLSILKGKIQSVTDFETPHVRLAVKGSAYIWRESSE